MDWLLDSAHGATWVLLIGLAVGVVIYFSPGFLAWALGISYLKRILLFNLLLGWTILGWMGVLIWAVLAQEDSNANSP